MAFTDQFEVFLRNALKQKQLENRLIKQALKNLRPVLIASERLISDSNVLSAVVDRNAMIQAITASVARSAQQSWGQPMLTQLQQELDPFIASQMAFARQMVEATGGTLPGQGLASVPVAQTVNAAVVNGKPLAEALTTVIPSSLADQVERYIRLGLGDVGGHVVASYQDAVVAVIDRNVVATIRTGIHEVGSRAQSAIYALEADPAWQTDGLVWTAVLDSRTCPTCVALDGREFPTTYEKVSPHMNCRCYLVPKSWRAPGQERIVTGDNGEARASFKTDASTWVSRNPDTAREIFGATIGSRLVGSWPDTAWGRQQQAQHGPPDKISFDQAVKLWPAS